MEDTGQTPVNIWIEIIKEAAMSEELKPAINEFYKKIDQLKGYL